VEPCDGSTPVCSSSLSKSATRALMASICCRDAKRRESAFESQWQASCRARSIQQSICLGDWLTRTDLITAASSTFRLNTITFGSPACLVPLGSMQADLTECCQAYLRRQFSQALATLRRRFVPPLVVEGPAAALAATGSMSTNLGGSHYLLDGVYQLGELDHRQPNNLPCRLSIDYATAEGR
jgi:hypothetical protein